MAEEADVKVGIGRLFFALVIVGAKGFDRRVFVGGSLLLPPVHRTLRIAAEEWVNWDL